MNMINLARTNLHLSVVDKLHALVLGKSSLIRNLFWPSYIQFPVYVITIIAHLRSEVQLIFLADVGAAHDQADTVGLVEADAHVRHHLRLALPQQERRLVVVVPREVDGAGHLEAVHLQRSQKAGDEVPGIAVRQCSALAKMNVASGYSEQCSHTYPGGTRRS